MFYKIRELKKTDLKSQLRRILFYDLILEVEMLNINTNLKRLL